MSVRITVSYTDDKELQQVIALLEPIKHHVDKKDRQTGKYKKADIIVKR